MNRNKESTPVSFAGGKRRWDVVPSPLTDMTTPDVEDLDLYDRTRCGGAKPAVRQTYTDRHTAERKQMFVQVRNRK